MPTWTETTTEALRRGGRRRSAARGALIELLGGQRCCLTAQEIFDALRASGRPVGIASVYRSLEQLTNDGFVQRVDVGDGTARFEPHHPDGRHHHHLVCAECGRVEAFADDELERVLHKVEGQTGYSVAHDVVLRGVCETCASS
ncbi:MAG: Fur family transcriptional regulator [Gaiellaceae bacterium]